jgi:magnesium-transporting ATPase (P-type)
MGLVLTVVIISSGIIKVVVSLSAQKKVVEMATFVGVNQVLRNGRWTEINSNHLVVGDVIEVCTGILSADVAILSGEVVVDESTLTGEALPVSKNCLKNEDQKFSKEGNAKLNILYAGTTVLETKCSIDREIVTAIVLDTGGSTEKGKLVRDILYPLPYVFVFTEHLKIVFFILILWGIVLLLASIFMLEVADLGSWFFGMFSISQVLSPVLPAVLVIGQSVSVKRLREKGIECVDLNRITLAGKVKVFCFDKTGTIILRLGTMTKEGLEFSGVREIRGQNEVTSLNSTFQSFSDLMKIAMQSCHSLSLMQHKVVGNFVDTEMFRATNATLDQRLSNLIHPMEDDSDIEIKRRFEFSHSHAYMASVCQVQNDGKSYVFLKGSSEKIMSLVRPSSIPKKFNDIVKSHAAEGYYIIAFAGKEITTQLADDPSTPRSKLEQDVDLIGILLFRNELKPDTPMALALLKEGGCRNVMITGDHQHTALFIAKASGLISTNEAGILPKVIMADFHEKVPVH